MKRSDEREYVSHSILTHYDLSIHRAFYLALWLCDMVWTLSNKRTKLHERLQREGVKTHKERVEDLNKYLSRLSEHHDMYVSFPLLQVAIP